MQTIDTQPILPNTLQATLFSKSDVAKRHHDVYDKLDSKHKEIIDTATTLFTNAWLSYQALNNPSTDSTNKICVAGVHAETFMSLLVYFKVLTDTDDNTVIDKLQTISDWLEKKNWIHLPTYININGETIHVMAAGMLLDMKANFDAVHRLRRSLGEHGRSESTRGLKKEDDSDVDYDAPMKLNPHSIERRSAQ